MKKEALCTTVGALVATLMGTWGPAYWALLVCQCVDFTSGSIVALVFHKSPKTETGGAESYAMFKGICKKFMMWMIIAMAHWLDVVLGFNYITLAVTYSFIANEALSVIENSGQMGLIKNATIINAIDILKKKSESMKD